MSPVQVQVQVQVQAQVARPPRDAHGRRTTRPVATGSTPRDRRQGAPRTRIRAAAPGEYAAIGGVPIVLGTTGGLATARCRKTRPPRPSALPEPETQGGAPATSNSLFDRATTMIHDDRRTLSDDLLAKPVRGRNLAGSTLGQNLGEGPCLLVFLRHFG